MCTTDGEEYDFLERACRRIKGSPGMTCEIGVREGGGSKIIMETCLDNGDPRIHVGIDPHGDLPYLTHEGRCRTLDYSNHMQHKMMVELNQWCLDHGYHFIFLPMEDFEFFQRFGDGIPVYIGGKKRVVNEYALVYFDGPHNSAVVAGEAEFFRSRTPQGGIWVFDDIGCYPHMGLVHPKLLEWGFVEIERGRTKVVYQRSPA